MTLAFIDTESTDLDPGTARIIQFAGIIPGRPPYCTLVNPGVPIPAAVVELTSITDADVAKAPKFSAIAADILAYLSGCDLVTFGGGNFDIPLLAEEFCRTGIEWSWKQHRHYDLGILSKKLNPRDLAAMHEKYTGRKLEDAHDALADARATESVFWGILRTHLDLGAMDPDSFAAECRYDDEKERVDPHGKLVLIDGAPCYNTFRNRGVRVRDDLGYANWILTRSDFPATTKRALQAIVDEIDSEAATAAASLYSDKEIPF